MSQQRRICEGRWCNTHNGRAVIVEMEDEVVVAEMLLGRDSPTGGRDGG